MNKECPYLREVSWVLSNSASYSSYPIFGCLKGLPKNSNSYYRPKCNICPDLLFFNDNSKYIIKKKGWE